MSPVRHALVLAVALTMSSAAAAESVGSVALVTTRPSLSNPYRFFGGSTASVPLLIHAPEPEGVRILADLVQLTANLAAPASRDLEVPVTGLPVAGPGIELDLSVALPVVSRETDFELRFRSHRLRDGSSQPAGRIALRVYPADMLSPVRAWAQSHALAVEDDHGSVIELLQRQKIPVAAQSATRGVTLYAGPRALQKSELRPLRDGETAVLFIERETETPYLLIDRTAQGTTVRVEMRLVDRLATDPLSHKILLEVFRHIHEQTPPTEGVAR